VGPVRPGRRSGAPYESHGWVGWVGCLGDVGWGREHPLKLLVERERGVLPVNNRCRFPADDELNGIEAGACLFEGRTPRCK
jgi:hypothetical protein